MAKILEEKDENLTDLIVGLVEDSGVPSEEAIPSLAAAICTLARELDGTGQVFDEIVRLMDEELE